MMMRFGLLIELLAIIALVLGVPVPVSATVALIAATPTTAVALFRLLKSDRGGGGPVDVAFLFFTWAMLPCLVALYATGGVSETAFRFIVTIRVFAAASIWALLNRWSYSEDGKDNLTADG